MKKAIFLSVIATLYKKDEASVTDHLKNVEGEEIDDAKVEEILKELDAEKVGTLKTEAKERFDNGVKKGQKDTAKKFEKKLIETFAVEEDLEGDELLQRIEEVSKESKAKASKDGKIDLSTVTPEDLEKIPAFINKQRDFQTQLKAKETEKETAVNEVKKEILTSALKAKASNLALTKLNERNPILPADLKKAEKVKKSLLVDELKDIPFMEAEDGTLIPLDAEGKPRTTANGVQLDFDTLVNDIIESNFEFAKTDKRESPKNKTNGGSGGSEEQKYKGTAPTSSKEYLGLLTSPDLSTEEKASVKEQYKEQFS